MIKSVPLRVYLAEKLKHYVQFTPQQVNELEQETLCVVTIAMICSTVASLWKSQYFQRAIYNPVEDLW